MRFFDTFNVSGSGLTAERLRMDIISKNIANANTTRTASGTPYRRQIPIFKTMHKQSFSDVFEAARGKNVSADGVEVIAIKDDMTQFKKVYKPYHPDSDENGYVLMPNVDVVSEMVNLISASRAYEANVAVINGTKSMAMKALSIGK